MSPADPEFLVAQKGALRQIMRARREEAGRAQPTAALALRDRFLASFSLPPSCLVASYRPFRNEIDPGPLAEALFARGHRLCLPVLSDKEKPLLFRLWEPTAPLAVNRWGLSEPLATATSIEPTVLLVPLLAFDRRGNRLGYGAGYYDRTLNNLRSCNNILTVGLSYSAQEVDNVPTGLTDARLDAALTEKSLFRFSSLSSMP